MVPDSVREGGPDVDGREDQTLMGNGGFRQQDGIVTTRTLSQDKVPLSTSQKLSKRRQVLVGFY